MPRRAPKNVFDPDRTDRDEPTPAPPTPLSALLPRVHDETAATADSIELTTPPARPNPPHERPDPHHDASPDGAPSRPRGIGGRPKATGQAGRITSVAARVPAELYAAALPLVKGVGKPSWGQLIAWTCEDHYEVVVSKVRDLIQTEGTTRTPRGQNKHGLATTQVTARFTPSEREVFDLALIASRADPLNINSEATITATAVIIAALMVAAGSQPDLS